MYLALPAPSRTVAVPGPWWTVSPPSFDDDCDATPPAVLILKWEEGSSSAAFAASTVVAVVECLTASPVVSPEPEYSFSVESVVPPLQLTPTLSPPLQSVLACLATVSK